MDACLIYFSISAWSYPFIALYNAGAALYRSMGNSRISMYTSIFMNIVNVSGNAICVYGLHMGVAGVAIPSLISRFLAAILMLLLVHSRENSVYVRYCWSELRPKALYMKRILHIALPSAMENSMFQLGRILVVSIITNFGTTQIAANGVANNLDNFGCIPGMAINLGIITVVGRCVGAGDLKQTRYYAKKLMRVCFLCTAVLNGIMMLTLPLILGLYSLSAETMQLTATLVYIHSGFLIPLYVPAFSIPNVLRSANDVKFPMCISIFSMWIFRIIFSYILGIYFGMGAIGVWCAMVADWAFRAICFSVRYSRGRWTKYAKYHTS
jgi:putative MATE family efflux protein